MENTSSLRSLYVSLLSHIRTILAWGDCRSTYALNSLNRAVEYNSSEARAWCITGAMLLALESSQLTPPQKVDFLLRWSEISQGYKKTEGATLTEKWDITPTFQHRMGLFNDVGAKMLATLGGSSPSQT